MYRCLQTIPASRKSRRSTVVSLESIENGLLEYETFESFVADLKIFLDQARDYFEVSPVQMFTFLSFQNHNERKLDELDELIISLNLPSEYA